VGPQRRAGDADQKPGGRVEQGQEVHDREAAPGLLHPRLAELLLQFRRVGHGDARPIDQEGAMAVPAAVVGQRTAEPVGDSLEQALEDGQREPGAGLAVRFAGAADIAEPGHVGARRVAVEDLEDEQVQRGHRVEDSFAPGVADRRTGLANRCGRQPVGDVRLDSANRRVETTGHPWPPVGVMR
jgi:hypothetical protein